MSWGGGQTGRPSCFGVSIAPPPLLKARLWLPARWDAGAPSGISLPPEYPNRSLVLSSLQTFKELGVSMARFCQPPAPTSSLRPASDARLPPQVLEEVRSPAGPLLHLAQPFHSSVSRGKLEAFIQQFTQP